MIEANKPPLFKIVLLSATGFFMFVCMDSLAKFLGTVMPVTQAVWGRFFFHFVALVIYFLIKRGIISRNIFTDNRKEIFVAVLIFSAIITPTGDPVTLFIFTIPLYMLIELVLYLSKNN